MVESDDYGNTDDPGDENHKVGINYQQQYREDSKSNSNYSKGEDNYYKGEDSI